MIWLVPISFYFVFGASAYLLRRVLAQKFPKEGNLINASFYVLFLLPAALILGLSFPHSFAMEWQLAALLFIGSLIWPLYNMTAFKASEHVDASVYSLMTNLSPLATFGLAFLFLNETLTSYQVCGLILLVVSGFIVLWPHFRRDGKADRQGLFFAFLSMLLLGAGLVFEKYMLGQMQFGTYLLYGWGAQILWMVFFSYRDLRRVGTLLSTPDRRRLILGYGLSAVMRSVMFISALQLSASASAVSAAGNFLTVVVLFAAFFVLKEKDNLKHKIVGAIVGIVGLLFIG